MEDEKDEYLSVTSRGVVTTRSYPEIFRIKSEGKGEYSLYHEDEEVYVTADSKDGLDTARVYDRYSAWIIVDSDEDDDRYDDALATY